MFEELLSRRGLSLDRLHSFLKVAEAGGIARAAGDDVVRQSQFSRQIGELEEFFGTQLTTRHGRVLALTEAGRELAALVRGQLRGFEDFLKSRSDELIEVQIGAGDSLLTWLLIPKLEAFQREFPRVQVKICNLRSGEIIQRVAEMRLDFGLARAGLVRPPLKHHVLGRVDYRLFVPKKFQRQAAHLTPLEMLVKFPIATLGSDAAFFGSVLRSAERRGSLVNLRLVTESFPQAARAVLSGGYAGILPAHAAGDLEPFGAVAFELPFLREETRKVALVWNARLLRTRPEGEAMRAALQKLLALG
jgi:DNA-binding transcriptional LysR family regulator